MEGVEGIRMRDDEKWDKWLDCLVGFRLDPSFFSDLPGATH